MSVHDFFKSFLPTQAETAEPPADYDAIGLENLIDDLPCAPFDSHASLSAGNADAAPSSSCLDSALAVIAQKLNEDEREADAVFGRLTVKRDINGSAPQKKKLKQQQQLRVVKKGSREDLNTKIQNRKRVLQQNKKQQKLYKLKSKMKDKFKKKSLPHKTSSASVLASTPAVVQTPTLKLTLSPTQTPTSTPAPAKAPAPVPPQIRSEQKPLKKVEAVLKAVAEAKKAVKKFEISKPRKRPEVDCKIHDATKKPAVGSFEARRIQAREAMLAAYRDTAIIRNKFAKIIELLVIGTATDTRTTSDSPAMTVAQLRKTVRNVCDSNAASFDSFIEILSYEVQNEGFATKPASQSEVKSEPQNAPADAYDQTLMALGDRDQTSLSMSWVTPKINESTAISALVRGHGSIHTALRLSESARFQPTVNMCCDPRSCLDLLCLRVIECVCALAPSLADQIIDVALQLQIRNAAAAAVPPTPVMDLLDTEGYAGVLVPSVVPNEAPEDERDELTRLVTSPHFVTALLDRLASAFSISGGTEATAQVKTAEMSTTDIVQSNTAATN